MEHKLFDVIIIGAGASGLFLASLLPANLSVALLETNDRVGKKLISTGNGKCNLTNLEMNIVHFNRPSFVENYLDRFDSHDVIRFFEQMGLLTKIIDNRVYPISECSSTVLDVLRYSVERAGTTTFTNHYANFIEQSYQSFTVSGVVSKKDMPNSSFEYKARAVVLATGSPATFGKNSTSLFLHLGHSARNFIPSLCPIRTEKEPIKGLQGVRAKVGIKLGHRYEVGEILFKDFGVSGIATFNIASEIARRDSLIHKMLLIDFMPDNSFADVQYMLQRRATTTCENMMRGTFHTKIVDRLLWKSGALPSDLAKNKVDYIAESIKQYPIKIEGLADISLSQVASGGLNVKEFDENLMSTFSKGAYAMGEVLDVDGDCGGYNLQWAWTSAKIVSDSLKKLLL